MPFNWHEKILAPNRTCNHDATALTAALQTRTNSGVLICEKARRDEPLLNLDFGAGDGIRTHDPNLGKVVLYP
jgi:hypothetical protein